MAWRDDEWGLFQRLDEPEWDALRDALDERQAKLVESAIVTHSLVNPGRVLTYRVHMGGDWQYPRLTDEGRYHTQLTAGAPLLGVVRARSLVNPTSDFSIPLMTSEGLIAPDRNLRHLLLTPAHATDETVRARHDRGWQVRLYDALEEHSPLVLDLIRDFFWRRFERDRDRYHQRRRPEEEFAQLRNVMPQALPIPRLAGPVREDAPAAVLIGMHWLQAGGAERWALETVQQVRDAGLLPIVVTDRDSQQPWVTRPELEGAVVMCLSHPMAGFPGDDVLLRAIAEQFDLRGVLVHHCQWLYDRLPLLRLSRPGLGVIDSLHVVEFGGGFPRASSVVDDAITQHHVISAQIEDWLVDRQRVDPSKVVLAPLSGLTLAESALRPSTPRDRQQFTVAFIGRKSRQKRPEAFLLLLKRAREAGLNLRAIIHGEGEMEGLVARVIERYGLGDVVELRTPEVQVGDTLAESDLLVITSSAEGITLTTFEAVGAGVPVLSTDVGAQSEVVPASALLPRPTYRMIPAAVSALKVLQDADARRELLEEERTAVTRLTSRPDASQWMKGVIDQWAR